MKVGMETGTLAFAPKSIRLAVARALVLALALQDRGEGDHSSDYASDSAERRSSHGGHHAEILS